MHPRPATRRTIYKQLQLEASGADLDGDHRRYHPGHARPWQPGVV